MSKFDVNGDGKVDYRDVLAAVGKALDLNGDGEVNLRDALWGASVVGASATTAGAAGYLSGGCTCFSYLQRHKRYFGGNRRVNCWCFSWHFTWYDNRGRIISC